MKVNIYFTITRSSVVVSIPPTVDSFLIVLAVVHNEINMISLDVHVANIPTIPREWLETCISSLEKARELADYPVNIHVFDGIAGHIGESRKLGYSMGKAKYVTYVDADDYVLPEAFSCLKEAMTHNPALIKTGEIRIQNGHEIKIPIGSFHLMVYRRDILDGFPFSKYPVSIDVQTKEIAENHKDGTINIPAYVYMHRIYWDSGSRVLYRKLKQDGIINV
jgi:hypothetical protein